jgi:FemAB-related protein (PEP-CTERM system-associated)
LRVFSPDLTGQGRVPWDAYVRAHPQGTLFHLSAWQRAIGSAFGHRPFHLAVEDPESGRSCGVLPLFLVRSRIFGRMLISTPQAAYGGILADGPEIAGLLLERARELAFAQRVRFLELRNFENDTADPALLKKDLYVTFRQELWRDPEKNYLAIPRKTRAVIREGQRAGLDFRVDEAGVDAFYAVYSRNVRQLGTPAFSKRLFVRSLEEFGSDAKIFSVHYRSQVVAAVVTFFYRDEILPYYGGALEAYRELGVSTFLYWMLMRYGCDKGFRLYDFGRSKKGTGSYSFKKHWGMTVSELPYRYLLVRQQSMPDTSPLNPKFSLWIRIWRRLPLPVTNTLGPLVSRHLI